MQTLTSKIAYNTFIQAIGKGASIILGLVVFSLMSRYLKDEGFGYYTTVVAYLQIFGILVDFGLNVIIVQMMSAPFANEEKVVSNIFTMRFFSALLFFGSAIALVWIFPYSQLVKSGAVVASISFFCISLIQILSGVYQKYLKMAVVSVAENAGRVVLLLFTLFCIYQNLNLNFIMLGVSLGSFINLLIVFAYCYKLVKIKFAFDFSLWKEILKKSWPIAISISLNLIYLRADTFILSLIKSPSDVGIYGAAYRVIDIVTIFPHMFMGLVLPILTFSWLANNQEKFHQRLQKAFDFFSVFGPPLVFGTLFLATPLMVLISGPDFTKSGLPLKILIFASLMIFYGTMFSYAVVAVEKQKKMIWGFLATAVLSLIGYIILIPKYSYLGAAGVTFFSESLIALIGAYITYKATNFAPKMNIALKSVFSSIIMSVFLYLLRDFSLIIQILVAVFVYFSVMYGVKGISIGMIKEVIGKTEESGSN